MISFKADEWSNLLKGYAGKPAFDKAAKKSMAAYTDDVVGSTEYVPKYSAREDEIDYEQRLLRTENSYFNFVRKIVGIYATAIFRSTEPARSSDEKTIERFWSNADGNGLPIGKFVKDRVFVLNQTTGGALVVIDKPRIETGGQISRQQQEEMGLFPYSYVIPWTDLVNYKVDRAGRLEWIIYCEGKDENGDRLYKVWDRTSWAVMDKDAKPSEQGDHNLGIVPVVRSIALGNPKNNFQTPLCLLADVVRISMKIYELMSQLDQIVIGHAFPKLAMPQSMFDKIKESGAGVFNILIYPDGYQGQQSHYIEMPSSEIESMIGMIFDKLPHMILEMATVRSKTDKPREESGVAKFIDSSDELSNLVDKAEGMEILEQQMTEIAARWERIRNPEFTVSYSKSFDVKTVNEQIADMVALFKEDLHAPSAAREMVKRVIRKMLGNVDKSVWTKIEEEIEASVDPALSLDDILKVIAAGGIDPVMLVQRYDPSIKTEEEARKKLQENIALMRGVAAFDSDGEGNSGDAA